MEMNNVPGRKISWYPRIDLEKCQGCRGCLHTCDSDVYEWAREEHHPIVARPQNCVAGCRACADVCKGAAISFPSEEHLEPARTTAHAQSC